MRRLLPTIFALLTLVPEPQDLRGVKLGATSAPAGKRIALVIGNARYPAAPLKNPLNDAAGMAQALSELGFEVIHKENVNGVDMRAAIQEFGVKLRGASVGLFYYAGHGIQIDGENYLIPTDANINTEDDVKLYAVGVGVVLSQMNTAGTGTNLIILDACRDSPITRSLRSGGRGLASILAPKGTFIAYATAPGSVASDGPGRNGVFTQELLKNIRTPGMNIQEMFMHVRVGVWNQTQGQQIPWESSALFSAFYFAGGQGTSPVPGQAATAQTLAAPAQQSQIRQAPRPFLPQSMSVYVSSIIFTLDRCVQSGETIECILRIHNEGPIRKLSLDAPTSWGDTQLTGQFGSKYRATKLLFEENVAYGDLTMGPGETRVAHITFGDNSSVGLRGATYVRAVKIGWSVGKVTEEATKIQSPIKFEKVPVLAEDRLPGAARPSASSTSVADGVWQGLQLGTYCKTRYGNSFMPVAAGGDAYSWRCMLTDLMGVKTAYPMDMDEACRMQYGPGFKATVSDPKEIWSWHCVSN